ncbi:MAG: hypothetical protein R3E08_07685 [Thiotrichaceae bacterium]
MLSGLVAITPASVRRSHWSLLLVQPLDYLLHFATKLKRLFGYDDSLMYSAFMLWVENCNDVDGRICCNSIWRRGLGRRHECSVTTEHTRASVLTTLVYSGVMSFTILKLIDMTLGLRVDEEQESQGLDMSLHDEHGYVL